MIVNVSKFSTFLVETCFTSPRFSRINFVCFAFEQYESVKIQLALSKAACFPISVNSYLAFELTLLQNGLLQKTNNSAWGLKRETSANINDIWMEIREPSRVHFLSCLHFFFSEICIPQASTLAKKPAKPQSTKAAHSTGYAMQNKVGPS